MIDITAGLVLAAWDYLFFCATGFGMAVSAYRAKCQR
jgi:hypothetical protein